MVGGCRASARHPVSGMPFCVEKGETMTEKEKYAQVKREAGATGLVLVVIILFWIAAGFGAAYIQVQFLHLPLWVWTACLGTWVVGMVLVRVLTKLVFRDMDLEEEKHG